MRNFMIFYLWMLAPTVFITVTLYRAVRTDTAKDAKARKHRRSFRRV